MVTNILSSCCGYIFVYRNSGLLSIGRYDSIKKLEKQLVAVKNDFKKLEPCEVDQKFPGLASQGLCAIYEGTAGLLKANKCIEALHVSNFK